jgi:hypothetical protein
MTTYGFSSYTRHAESRTAAWLSSRTSVRLGGLAPLHSTGRTGSREVWREDQPADPRLQLRWQLVEGGTPREH